MRWASWSQIVPHPTLPIARRLRVPLPSLYLAMISETRKFVSQGVPHFRLLE